MADINISVALDSKTAEQSAKNLDNKLRDLGTSADKAKPSFDGLWKQIFAGVSVAAVAGKAVHEFTQFIGNSITAAIEAEKVNAALKSALGSTGREADANSKHFIDYASSLQKATIYNDEAIKGAQTLLVQLTTLDREGIDRATRGAIGLASVLGIDLNSAAMLVAKSMEGNTAALGRYGIKVKETGTAEEKRNELLEKLEGFYKRATDATDTFAGRQAQLKNNLDEFKETVGKAIIENKMLQKTAEDLSLSFQYLAEHGGALKKVVDSLFVGLMGPGTMVVLKLMGLLADKQRDLNKAAEEGVKWAGGFNEKLIAIAKSGQDLSGNPILKFFVDLAKVTKDGHAAFHLTDEYAKQFGVTLKTKVIEQINDTKLALDRLRKSGEATPGAIAALEKRLKELNEYLKGTKKASTEVAVTLINTLTPAVRDLNEIWKKTPQIVDQAYVQSVKSLGSWVKEHKTQIEGVIAFTQQSLGLLQSLYSSYYSNRMTEIDNDYQKRKDAIEKSTMNEEEKAKALEALDREYAEKKKKLQKEAGEKQKALAIVQAIINTAEAVTKAWTVGPILGPIMAVLAAAMGAVQIALIKKQAIPLARGAVFDRPTFLAGEAGREAMLPIEPLMREIRAAIVEGIRGRGAGGGAQAIHVYIGQEELDKRIIKTTTRQGNLGRLNMPSKVVQGGR